MSEIPGGWTCDKVRSTFIEYFEKKQGHTFWPSRFDYYYFYNEYLLYNNILKFIF